MGKFLLCWKGECWRGLFAMLVWVQVTRKMSEEKE